ncbi:MAG: hypothetical protein AAGC85_01210 [Bacteroidota bacterium]
MRAQLPESVILASEKVDDQTDFPSQMQQLSTSHITSGSFTACYKLDYE